MLRGVAAAPPSPPNPRPEAARPGPWSHAAALTAGPRCPPSWAVAVWYCPNPDSPCLRPCFGKQSCPGLCLPLCLAFSFPFSKTQKYLCWVSRPSVCSAPGSLGIPQRDLQVTSSIEREMRWKVGRDTGRWCQLVTPAITAPPQRRVGTGRGRQKRGRRPSVPALPVAEPSLGRGWCWAAEGDGGTLSPSHALSTRSEVQPSAGEARAGPSPHPHERGGHTAAQGGSPQPEPLLRTEREITETLGRVPEAHEGSMRRGEGQCPDRGSGMEKPSSARGRQCPQRLGSRGPARLPQPGTPAPARPPRHCRPASVISESVLIDPLPPVRGVGWGGGAEAVPHCPPYGHGPHTEPPAPDTCLKRKGGKLESNQGKEKGKEKQANRRQTSWTPSQARGVCPPLCPGAHRGPRTVASAPQTAASGMS